MNEVQLKEMNKLEVLEFKYERYNNLESVITGLVQKDSPAQIDLWK